MGWRLSQPLPWCFGRLLFVAGAGLVLTTGASAHDFGVGKNAYEDFLVGNQAIFSDLPVLLGALAAGLLAGIWKADGFPALWLSLIVGLVVGSLVGFFGAPPPLVITYVTIILVGLLGAAALNLPLVPMRGIFFLAGGVFSNAVFSGHTPAEIAPLAYVGIFFAINFLIASTARLVYLTRENLPYTWVPIAWRAGSSW
ncbi:MAG: hypothetical protein AAGM04_13570, partial [Pseudomonadota bacterium]